MRFLCLPCWCVFFCFRYFRCPFVDDWGSIRFPKAYLLRFKSLAIERQKLSFWNAACKLLDINGVTIKKTERDIRSENWLTLSPDIQLYGGILVLSGRATKQKRERSYRLFPRSFVSRNHHLLFCFRWFRLLQFHLNEERHQQSHSDSRWEYDPKADVVGGDIKEEVADIAQSHADKQ